MSIVFIVVGIYIICLIPSVIFCACEDMLDWWTPFVLAFMLLLFFAGICVGGGLIIHGIRML